MKRAFFRSAAGLALTLFAFAPPSFAQNKQGLEDRLQALLDGAVESAGTSLGG
jgi:hypothetical protein